MRSTGRWGSQLEINDGSGTLHDRNGELIVRMDGGRIWLRGGPGRELTVEPRPDDEPHLIFGPCARLLEGDRLCSLMGEVQWKAPQSIPPVESPARLPPLTGSLLLDWLAHCALAAEIPSLSYVGPYPTPALFSSLRQCFTPLGDEAAFTAEAETLLLAPRMQPAPVAFLPAPFERWWIYSHLGSHLASPLGIQARAQLERVFLDGASFERSTTALHRLVEHPDPTRATAGTLAAELWFGETPWATLAELSPEGELLRGPLPPPPIDDPIVDSAIPQALRLALAGLIADGVPGPLASFVEPILARTPMRWGDAGLSAVRTDARGLILHAALWLSNRAGGAGPVALAMASALTPWVIAEALRGSSVG
jgi:hypothetical protein